MQLVKEIVEACGGKPFVVIARMKRKYVDANCNIGVAVHHAAVGDAAIACYHRFHDGEYARECPHSQVDVDSPARSLLAAVAHARATMLARFGASTPCLHLEIEGQVVPQLAKCILRYAASVVVTQYHIGG